MAYWSQQSDGQYSEPVAAGTVGTPGTLLTAGAAVGQLTTTATQIVASCPRFDMTMLHVDAAGTGAATKYMLNLYLGGAGVEQPILQDFMIQVARVEQSGYSILLPLAIAEGQRISAKLRSSVASATMSVHLTTIQTGFAPWPTGTRIVPYGTLPDRSESTVAPNGTTVSPGTTAHTKPAYATLLPTHTTTHYHRCFILATGHANLGTNTQSIRWLMDIQAGGQDWLVNHAMGMNFDIDDETGNYRVFPMTVPIGRQFSVRASSSVTSSNAFEMALYGVVG